MFIICSSHIKQTIFNAYDSYGEGSSPRQLIVMVICCTIYLVRPVNLSFTGLRCVQPASHRYSLQSSTGVRY
jgi:hypothetical protein